MFYNEVLLNHVIFHNCRIALFLFRNKFQTTALAGLFLSSVSILTTITTVFFIPSASGGPISEVLNLIIRATVWTWLSQSDGRYHCLSLLLALFLNYVIRGITWAYFLIFVDFNYIRYADFTHWTVVAVVVCMNVNILLLYKITELNRVYYLCVLNVIGIWNNFLYGVESLTYSERMVKHLDHLSDPKRSYIGMVKMLKSRKIF